MALFDAQDYWDELRESENPDKREIILKYEELFGSLKDMDIRQTRFYRYYLSVFDIPFRVNVPEDLEDDFDWDLLFRLVVGSLSSETRLVINEEWLKDPVGQILVDMYIKVKSGDQEIEKKLDELWSFQVLRLFEIYVEEQMNLLVTACEDEFDGDFDDDDDDDEVDVFKCNGYHLPAVNDNRGDLGEERFERLKRFTQQIESVRAKMDTVKEEETLNILLNELQEQNEAFEE